MKIFSKIFLFVLVSGIFISCKKTKLPEEQNGPQVFYFKGLIDGNAVTIYAGEKNYKMNPSLGKNNSSDVYSYNADLVQTNCNGSCGYNVSVQINDTRTSGGLEPNYKCGLRKGNFIFNDANLPSLIYVYNFTPALLRNPEHPVCIWHLKSSNPKEKDIEFNTIYPTFNLYSKTQYSLTLDYFDGWGDSASHQCILRVGYPFQSTMSVSRDNSVSLFLQYNFTANLNGGKPPYTYLWDFGDGATSSEVNPAHTYNDKFKSVFNTSVRIIDSNNDTTYSYYQVDGGFEPWITSNFDTQFIRVPDSVGLSSITVLITSPDGTVYSTKNTIQNSSGSFEVLDVSDYKESDVAVKKLKIKLNCNLSNGTRLMQINNAELVMAFGYK